MGLHGGAPVSGMMACQTIALPVAGTRCGKESGAGGSHRAQPMSELPLAAVQRQPKLAGRVAASLEAPIARRRLPAGEKLPPERALCGRDGAGRTARREGNGSRYRNDPAR